MSEFAVLCSVYVLLAACLVALFLDGDRTSWLGAPLGLVVAVMLATGRSALPMVPIVAAALAARAIVGTRDPSSTRLGGAVRFWVGFMISSGAVIFMLHPEYPPPVDLFPPIAQETLLPAFRWGWNHPWIVGVLALAGLAVESVAAEVRGRIPQAATDRVGRMVAWICYCGAALVLVSFAGSLVVDYPNLAALEQSRPPVSEYVINVLKVVVTTFRLSDPDLLLTASFIGGFGWVDTLPAKPFVTTLVFAMGVATIGLLLQLAQQRDARRLFWLVAMTAGWLVALSLYAVATHGMGRNLHGRYLVGPYLCMAAVLFSAFASTRFREHRWLRIPPGATIMFASAAIHVYCLRLILMRYF